MHRGSAAYGGRFRGKQKGLQTGLATTHPIGTGSDNSDSHNIQLVVGPSGMVANEGDVQVAMEPYQIPCRVMLPKRAEAENLLVPVCFSASHVAYSSLRMEPLVMITGQAAAVAAVMEVKSSEPLQDIDVPALAGRLRERRLDGAGCPGPDGGDCRFRPQGASLVSCFSSIVRPARTREIVV